MNLADTNVLVGLIRAEDESRAVERAIAVERVAERGEPLVVLEAVLCETVWVLLSAYRMSSRDAADALIAVLSTASIVPAEPRVAFETLRLVRENPGLDVVDCLLAAHSLIDGAAVVTLDRRLARIVEAGGQP